ncbi:MAG: TonB family protein [Terriglobales bacterium]
MAATQSNRLYSEEMFPSENDPSPQVSCSSRSGTLDESTALASLKELVAAGDHGLDPMLETITDAARLLTGASGAALATWKDRLMVCRARSGETAPPLGAQLDAETGISGECLRTGAMQHCTDAENDTRVDAEVCRSLGLRSIAVLPIQSTRETNGILVTFSTQPDAFTERHIALLRQLASLAERARAAEPVSVMPVEVNRLSAEVVPGEEAQAEAEPRSGSEVNPGSNYEFRPEAEAASLSQNKSEAPQSSTVLPPPDGVWDVVHASLGTRSRPLVWGAVVLAAIALFMLAVWLGWRGSGGTDGQAHAATKVPVATAAAGAVVPSSAAIQSPLVRIPDNDSVWAPNPGGETLPPSGAKASIDTSVKLASQLDKAAAKKAQPKHAPTVAQSGRAPEGASFEPPPLPADSSSHNDVGEVLSAKVSVPAFPLPVSQGVSGGRLLHSVPPNYPAGARQLLLEGKVVLDAMILEDGTVGDVKVVKGSPLLGRSAMDAVKKWRYEPYQLDGKPVKNKTMITVEFKLPSSAK